MKENAKFWNCAGKSLEFQGNFQSASSCYERSLKSGDDSAETLVSLAASNIRLYEFYSEDRYLESAKAHLLEGIEKDPENPMLHHYLGLVYLEMEERDMAMREFFSEAEKRAEKSSELIMYFEIEGEEAEEYRTSAENPYELLPDPLLYKVFDLLKSFPVDSSLFLSLRDAYGNKESASLIALYLRSIYYKIFDEKKFPAELGLKTEQAKWEALLIFFVRGINDEAKGLVKRAVKEGKLNLAGLPAYTKLLILRYRREVKSSIANEDSFRALTMLPMKKLGALDGACELAGAARESGGGAREARAIWDSISKVGLGHKKRGRLYLAKTFTMDDDGKRVEKALGEKKYTREMFILLEEIFRKKRFAYALDLAKKIRALYDENEAKTYIKEVLARTHLKEEEKFEIFSEI